VDIKLLYIFSAEFFAFLRLTIFTLPLGNVKNCFLELTKNQLENMYNPFMSTRPKRGQTMDIAVFKKMRAKPGFTAAVFYAPKGYTKSPK